MKKVVINLGLALLGCLPLWLIRKLGAGLGLLILRFSNKSAKRLPHNLLITGLATPNTVKQLTRATAKALGMTLLEAIAIAWQKDCKRINKLFSVDESFYQVKQLLSDGKRVVFLTPHIGNFELAVK
jgi:KDO2-lipid IV(A) lauroyltransferase